MLQCGPPLGGVTPRPYVRPSVCLFAPTVNSKTENRTTFKLRGEVTHVRSRPNWQSNFRGQNVTGVEKGGPHIVSVVEAALISTLWFVLYCW